METESISRVSIASSLLPPKQASEVQTIHPTFDIEHVQLQFQLNHALKNLAVQNDKMYLILSKIIYKIDLKNPSKVNEYTLPGKITNSWLHPNGKHLIVQVNTTYFYLHDTYKNFKILPRLKNLEVNQISFISGDIESTGDFLLSTSDGALYIALIKSHDPITHETKRDDKYVKQIYKFKTTSGEISGIAFSNNNTQITIFIGILQYTWDCFDTSYVELLNVFKANLPKITNLEDDSNEVKVNGNLEKDVSYAFASNTNLYAYINSNGDINTNDTELPEKLNLEETVSSFVISPHHLIIKSDGNLIVLNKLSGASTPLNLKDHLNEELLGITADYLSNTYWLYTSGSIYELVVSNESISVWYNYYKMGRYDEALQILEGYKTLEGVYHKKDVVLIKQGYDYLERGQFGNVEDDLNEEYSEALQLQIKGLQILAKLSEPFEKICLMILNLQSNSLTSEKLLLEYLLAKFEIANSEKNTIRMMILSSWIVELLLRMLHQVDRFESTHKSVLINKKFEKFVLQNYQHFDRKTIYQIITDLHYPTKLLFYAELIEDFEFMLTYYINVSNWKEALRSLVKLFTSNIKTRHEIIYENATVLLVNSPKRTIETWLRLGDGISYEKFLPSILTYNKNNEKIALAENYSAQFLLKVIFDEGVKNKQINNYYLSLLITYPRDKPYATKQIVKFLTLRLEATNSSKLYDSHFILRLCLSYKQFQPAVLILLHDMNLFDQALKLALDNELDDLGEFVLRKYDEFTNVDQDLEKYDLNDVEQDITVVSKIKLEEENYSTKKKLWILFSKNLIDRVCSGGDVRLGEDDVNEEDAPNEDRNGVSVNNKDVNGDSETHDDVNEVTSNLNAPPVILKKLNKALKYILELSNSSGGIIGLKDLLPLFPESILINNFKDEIVRSLNQYNNKINQLQLEMKESLNISNNLKQQIKDSSQTEAKAKVHSIIKPGEPCYVCQNLLLTRTFIVFPNCLHGFHKDCLIRYYLKLKGNYKFKKIYQNFKKNVSVVGKGELDEVLCKQCHLCNESNISLIDGNLVDEWEQGEIAEWEL